MSQQPSFISALWYRWVPAIYDRLFYAPTVRTIGSVLLYGRLKLRSLFGAPKDAAFIVKLSLAARLAEWSHLRDHLTQEIAQTSAAVDPQSIRWEQVVGSWNPRAIEKAVILKPYLNEREPGVILISFEYQWARLLALKRLEEFARRYRLVLVPSASPPIGLVQSVFPRLYPQPVLQLLANDSDTVAFQVLSPHVHLVQLYASSWIQPDIFRPDPPVVRDIDLLMIGNFAPVKRHFALFEALRSMPRSLRVVTVGQPDRGYTVEHIRLMAAAYGVSDRFEQMESLPYDQIALLLRRAKVSVVLSRREGSSMVVTESLLSNTPVGLYHDAVIGSRVFINEHTGRLLHYPRLGEQLTDFIAHAGQYQPRAWALEHPANCITATKILNKELRKQELASGRDWTQDIAVHYWDPDPRLANEQQQLGMAAERQRIQEEFGIAIGREKPAPRFVQ